jgi:hypothetical protein
MAEDSSVTSNGVNRWFTSRKASMQQLSNAWPAYSQLQDAVSAGDACALADQNGPAPALWVADLGEYDTYEDGLQQHCKDALDAHQPGWKPAVANGVRAIACSRIAAGQHAGFHDVSSMAMYTYTQGGKISKLQHGTSLVMSQRSASSSTAKMHWMPG